MLIENCVSIKLSKRYLEVSRAIVRQRDTCSLAPRTPQCFLYADVRPASAVIPSEARNPSASASHSAGPSSPQQVKHVLPQGPFLVHGRPSSKHGDRSIHSFWIFALLRKLQPAQHRLKPRVGTQAIQSGFHFEVNQPPRAVLVGFFQQLKGLVFLAKPCVDQGHVKR